MRQRRNKRKGKRRGKGAGGGREGGKGLEGRDRKKEQGKIRVRGVNM